MAQRYFLKLAYDGTPFHGWQVQPNAKSIQECVNAVLSTVLRTEIHVVGCGRTDTGVHAREFFAHFDTEPDIDRKEDLLYRANQMLPKEIALYELFPVKADAHARFSALARTYEYLVTKRKNPFAANRMLEFRSELDLGKMNDACQVMFEFEDFESFSKSGSQTEHHLCELMHAAWTASDDVVRFEVKANRFLRNMVRAIVGTMLEVGQGKISIEQFREIIAARDRTKAAFSAAACGLYLIKIDYREEIAYER